MRTWVRGVGIACVLGLWACADDGAESPFDGEESSEELAAYEGRAAGGQRGHHGDRKGRRTRRRPGRRDGGASSFPGQSGRDGGIGLPGGGGLPDFPDSGGPSVGGDTRTPDPSTEPAPSDTCADLTYESFGKDFVAKYCIACHQGAAGMGGVDLSSLSSIARNKGEIQGHAVRTPASNPMPPPGLPQPSADERADLGDWLSCGPQ